jgi:hypothetical protein
LLDIHYVHAAENSLAMPPIPEQRFQPDRNGRWVSALAYGCKLHMIAERWKLRPMTVDLKPKHYNWKLDPRE